MQFEDQQLTCVDCNNGFTWTANEQQFYAEREFTPPKRCKTCRAAKKAQRNGGNNGSNGPRNY